MATASAPLYGDSLVDVSSRLLGSLQIIDSVGRAQGTLPDRLEEALPTRWLRDIFGNPLEYSVAGLHFTLRSAGRDGMIRTEDDIAVTGRVGRSIPCELQIGSVVELYEDKAPLCSEVPVVVLPRCPEAEFRSLPELSHTRGRNRILATGERLVHLARRIEGRGRSLGALPPPAGVPWLDFHDAWRRPVQYLVTGYTFELRSAGADGVHHTDDDIVVNAELGGVIPCEFTHGTDRRVCSDPLPQCPGAGDPIIQIGADSGSGVGPPLGSGGGVVCYADPHPVPAGDEPDAVAAPAPLVRGVLKRRNAKRRGGRPPHWCRYERERQRPWTIGSVT